MAAIGGEIMDAETSQLESRCLPLGYFVQPYQSIFLSSEDMPEVAGAPQFMYICDKGRELKKGKWGNFDESLQFLGLGCGGFDIVGSSNGFLLCSTNGYEEYDYIICNPVTREFRILPNPPDEELCYVSIAFLCGGSSTSLDDVCYEVISAKIPDDRSKFSKVLEIETFSSVTNEWSEASLVCTSESGFQIDSEFSAFTIRDVIFSPTFDYALLAYDRSRQHVRLIKAPAQNGQELQMYRKLFGKSGGKVHCVMNNDYDIEVWELEDFEIAENWIMKHQLSFSDIRNQNPSICFGIEFSFRGFHPHKPHLILACSLFVPYWCDMESRKLSLVFGYNSFGMTCEYFLFEYNVDNLDDDH